MTGLSRQRTLARLYRLAPRGAELGLARMDAAAARFGHPEREFASVHVAGTNGKGSVCAMVAAMASAGGKLTGLYTSPHLCRFTERIQVDGAPVDERTLFPALDSVLREAPELTFFEAATLTAFLTFGNLDVDLAVLEVGLGGRLDATNIVRKPEVTAITTIGLDHTDKLGPDVDSIAREKAGILKPGVPVVVGALDPVAMHAIETTARDLGVRVIRATNDGHARELVQRFPPALLGEHQKSNAMVAAVMARLIGVRDDAIARGLQTVRWPGRLESIAVDEGNGNGRDGEVLLDAAHNPDGAEALASALRARNVDPRRTALLFGAMADKDYRSMLNALSPLAHHRVYVMPKGRKAASTADLHAACPGEPSDDVPQGLERARRLAGPGGLVVVAGSIFLVGEVRALLLGLPSDPPVAL